MTPTVQNYLLCIMHGSNNLAKLVSTQMYPNIMELVNPTTEMYGMETQFSIGH